MRTFVMINIGFMLGFIAAIPTGACQIEVAKRSLHDHLLSAIMVIVGSMAADLIYGCVAFFGLAPFLENKTVVAVFELVSTFLLWVLAYFTLKQSAKPHITQIDMQILQSKRVGFVTGFLLASANPLIIFWWLVGAKIILDLKVVYRITPYYSMVFVVAGVVGMATYLGVLAFILNWAKKFITHTTIQRINLSLGAGLALLSFYFLYTSLKVLLH